MMADSAELTGDRALEVRGLSKRYREHPAVSGVSFSLAESEVISIIGPSGSGKTTLLRCISLLERPETGVIEWPGLNLRWDGATPDGRIVDSVAEELHRNVGVVFQGLNLWESRSVWENLTLAPRLVLRLSHAEIEERATKLCSRLGIESLMRAWAWQLSGGQRQRVALARALMMRPRALLLDEVTSALDPLLTVEIMHFLRELREGGMTMIIVSHQIEFAAAISDRMMFLSGGAIAQQGTPQDLLERPASEELKRFCAALREVR